MIPQYVYCIAFNSSGRVTDDEDNITGTLAIDDGAHAALTNNTATQIGNGLYRFALEDAERTGTRHQFDFVSATSGVQVVLANGIFAKTVIVQPSTAVNGDRVDSERIQVYIGETHQVSRSIYASDGATAVDVSGETLKVVIENEHGTDLSVITSGSITVGGDENNVVSFDVPSEVSDAVRCAPFSIRRTSDNYTFNTGYFEVLKAAQEDS